MAGVAEAEEGMRAVSAAVEEGRTMEAAEETGAEFATGDPSPGKRGPSAVLKAIGRAEIGRAEITPVIIRMADGEAEGTGIRDTSRTMATVGDAGRDSVGASEFL
jgi:hypothetical protein